MTTLFSLRTALKNPDVSWDRKNNPEPWQHYADKQYKVIKQKYLKLSEYLFIYIYYLFILYSSSILQLSSSPAKHRNTNNILD